MKRRKGVGVGEGGGGETEPEKGEGRRCFPSIVISFGPHQKENLLSVRDDGLILTSFV